MGGPWNRTRLDFHRKTRWIPGENYHIFQSGIPGRWVDRIYLTVWLKSNYGKNSSSPLTRAHYLNQDAHKAGRNLKVVYEGAPRCWERKKQIYFCYSLSTSMTHWIHRSYLFDDFSTNANENLVRSQKNSRTWFVVYCADLNRKPILKYFWDH